MKKVILINETGQNLTEVNINAKEEETVDCIQWGGSIFVLQPGMTETYKIATVKPAIIKTTKRRNV